MFAFPLRAAAILAAATIGLSACAVPYGGFGIGVGNAGYYDPYYGGGGYGGYGSYGYGGYPAYGSGYGYGYGYPSSGYGGYGYPSYGYGSPYGGGWYNNHYYPGTGYYVYRDGRRSQMTAEQRRYFEELRRRWQNRASGSGEATQTRVEPRQAVGTTTTRTRQERPRILQERTQARQERRSAQTERTSTRTERRDARTERRQQRLEQIQANRTDRND